MKKLKGLYEKRNDLILEMEELTNKATEEKRGFEESEQSRLAEIRKEMKGLDEVIKAEEELRDIEKSQKTNTEEKRSIEEQETRAFANYIRGIVSEERAQNLDKSSNGAVIPTTIADKIIEKVKELSPIYELSTKFNVNGELVFPVWDESTEKITVAYADEFQALTSTSGKFTSVSLKGFLSGALTKVSRSLINNSDFDLTNYIINKMAEAVAEFLERELITGNAGKMKGLVTSTNEVKAAANNAITLDEIVALEMAVPQVYRKDGVFIMHPKTLLALRKLKYTDGRMVIQEDATKKFGYNLLGHEIYTSENAPEIATGKKVIYFGDMSGMYVKITETPTVDVLREKFADEHVLGVIVWLEMDSAIIETQKIACLKMA
ncbi:HK97 family phage major capsid protein [Peptoanaerobacter stomatis]|uniref:HK97 family phage major capsid protein n=1 Tax=Peptoanaerobacter stomatis TaxID=796937 RepID=G9XA53_9FIRM|nr:phage major capsid protein [Peptoanaerobacter stomatis]EHL20299.1 HK97 family phage major capsid protein [Peptoanaerobacter stomatis]